MKVTRKMLHEDLQPLSLFLPAHILKHFYRGPRRMKFVSNIVGRMIQIEPPESVEIEEQYLPTSDGETETRVKIYRPKGQTGELPAMLYTHGGGYVSGSPDVFDGLLAKFIERRPCVIVAPAYRNALVKPYPAAFNDCYETLLWMRDNAAELNIDSSQFMVAGHSAGGGLTAAVTLKARDTKDVKIAFQMPLYPMIDNLQPTDPQRYMDTPGWDTKANAFGWGRYLGDLTANGQEIPAYAAPARNTDYANFPPTITFVGQYEPFYWETVEYVDRLKAAGVDVTFKVYEGCTHGHEQTAPNSSIGQDGVAFTYDNYANYYDKYVLSSRAQSKVRELED